MCIVKPEEKNDAITCQLCFDTPEHSIDISAWNDILGMNALFELLAVSLDDFELRQVHFASFGKILSQLE